jgi:hypothetical protein
MRHSSLSFVGIFLSFTTLQWCAAACSESQSSNYERLPVSLESTLGSQGDASMLRSSPTLRGLDNKNGSNVSAAPGAEAMMTQDLLLVNPNKDGKTPQPLQSFAGQTLKITVDHSKIKLRGLAGVMITVINETSRPLVVDGDQAKAIIANQTHQTISLQALQKMVLPSKTMQAQIGKFVTEVVPSGLSVGTTTTVEDYITMKRPIRKRYGADQRRRLAELTRFGERILWPHQETQGILYFDTDADLSTAKVQLPAHTLFDASDKAILEGS